MSFFVDLKLFIIYTLDKKNNGVFMKRIYLAKNENDIPDQIKKAFIKEGSSYYIEDTQENRIKYESILPLGYSLKKINLMIDLIPRNSWGASLANSLTPKSWDSVRKPFIEKYGNRCQICGRKGEDLSKSIRDVDTHELWDYGHPNKKIKTQKLLGFVAVCSSCHLMFHLGFASTIGKQEVTIKRMQRLEKLSDLEMKKRISTIFSKWESRSEHDWMVDISILREHGFNNLKFKKKVDQSTFIY